MSAELPAPDEQPTSDLLSRLRDVATDTPDDRYVLIDAGELLALVECAELVLSQPCICHLCDGKCTRCQLEERLSYRAIYFAQPPAVGDAWVIVFADVDRPDEHFSGHGAEQGARRRFYHASAAWTCRLFRCVAETGYGPTPTKCEGRS